MADINWPSGVPVGMSSDGYSETPPSVVVRTNMDSGPPKVRRRFTAGISQITCITAPLDETQLDDLLVFFTDTTAGGALRFNMAHPRTGTTIEARFAAEPQINVVAARLYRASLRLEIMP